MRLLEEFQVTVNAKETHRYVLLFYFLRQFFPSLPLPFSFLALKYLTWVTLVAEKVTLQTYKLSFTVILIHVFTQKILTSRTFE